MYTSPASQENITILKYLAHELKMAFLTAFFFFKETRLSPLVRHSNHKGNTLPFTA